MCFDENLSWYISVPSLVVGGLSIGKLHALAIPSFCCLRLFVVVYKLAMFILVIGYMSIPRFIIPGSCIYGLYHINCLYHLVVYKNINMLLHDLSWIPIIMQSCTPVSCLVFEIRLSKLNNNKKKVLKTDLSLINKELILQFSPFSVYMDLLAIQIGLMCQNWDLTHNESET